MPPPNLPKTGRGTKHSQVGEAPYVCPQRIIFRDAMSRVTGPVKAN